MKLLAEGDLTRSINFNQTKVDVRSQDEVGKLAIEFNDMLSSLRLISEAYNQVTLNLRDLIGQIAHNATSLNTASSQLAVTANQSGQASSQISTTIQQVVKGISQQSESISRTASSI